jgi:hypothetical protein
MEGIIEQLKSFEEDMKESNATSSSNHGDMRPSRNTTSTPTPPNLTTSPNPNDFKENWLPSIPLLVVFISLCVVAFVIIVASAITSRRRLKATYVDEEDIEGRVEVVDKEVQTSQLVDWVDTVEKGVQAIIAQNRFAKPTNAYSLEKHRIRPRPPFKKHHRRNVPLKQSVPKHAKPEKKITVSQKAKPKKPSKVATSHGGGDSDNTLAIELPDPTSADDDDNEHNENESGLDSVSQSIKSMGKESVADEKEDDMESGSHTESESDKVSGLASFNVSKSTRIESNSDEKEFEESGSDDHDLDETAIESREENSDSTSDDSSKEDSDSTSDDSSKEDSDSTSDDSSKEDFDSTSNDSSKENSDSDSDLTNDDR